MLIKAPFYCIDYVLLHFKYNNHSACFYQMLYELMPDWQKRKAILDEAVVVKFRLTTEKDYGGRTFDDYKKVNAYGEEFWYARGLQ